VKKYVLHAGVLALLLYLAYRTFDRTEESNLQQPAAINLVLISIDTVRPDYLQVYNSKGAPTPNLSKLAGRGFLFTHAISQVPFTLPSHSTMLTGTYPATHGVRENIATRLGDSAVTLAEVLKSRGYQTAGFIGSVVLESGTGIEQGFDTYDDLFLREHRTVEDRSGIQKDAGTVKRSFVRWLDESGRSSPFFSFIHFYDPHAPYDPPAPFRSDQGNPETLYKGELQYVDSVIGEVVQELSRRQLLNQTMLVITGDHG
jgi:membrane-anchored protein YejM (alkaline phosphatase superfamily)